MRTLYVILSFFLLSISNIFGQDFGSTDTRDSASSSIPGDNTMRYYRLAIPVTRTAYVEDLGENYNNVLQFWRDCEEFANRMFVPLGICFDVVEDQRLVKTDYFTYEEDVYALQANGTTNTNNLIGADSYDVGMWVHHRDLTAENSGLSAEGGVYRSIAKGSGYSKTDKWVVAHELGHMFGAPHTTTGEGSLMDSGGDDFFSYPSIKKIRELAVEKGAGSAYNAVKVSNSAPVFVNANMKDSYRIPQGACIAIPVYANDTDGHMLTYSAIGCSSSTVGNVIEGGYMPHFASVIPQTDNIIDYRPEFTADIYYDDFYYEQSGTNIPAMSPGSYNIAILVNDIPSNTEYGYLVSNPFYSNYAVWDATVQIVGGTSFNASMSPVKNSYSAGEQVTVSWGVNSNYFTADSRLRITMSTDYGKTFAYVLADDVPALDGSKAVTLPDINVGNIDVDFKTATRSMRGGIIRVEEIGGVAYTLTTLSPENGGGFNITGGGDEPMTYTINVTAGDGGTASIDGKSSTTVVAGSSVTLTATPNDGYIFDCWYSGDRFVSLEAEYTFTPTASGTYNALFEKEAGTPVTYKITATANPIEGGTATVNGGTSATVEANGTIELSAKANDGYTFVNWTSGGKEVTTQADYKIYNVTGDADYIANFKLETTATEYPTPTGKTYTDNYLTSITTTGGDTNIGYSANAHPGQCLVVVPGKVQLEKGKSFTMSLIAKSLGAGSNSIVREDMRYCHASLFTDFDQDFTFEASPVQTWGVKGPSGTNPYAGGNSNVYGNYDYVMNITHTITVPDDAPAGESHIRMIYTNAWDKFPTNGTAELDKGIVYDIVVEVVEKVDITANAGEGGSVTINGEAIGTKRVIKGSEVTLAANANNGYNFTGWYNGKDLVSNENPYTFTATTDITYTANFEQNGTFPDGAYKIFWQQNGRGYLAYHTSYPDEAKLADVTLGNYGGSHFSSTSPDVDLVWYLITADDGKRYLFHAATGKFLIAGTSDAGANAKANKLSTTEALPIRIEENTAHSGYYVLMATVNDTDALLSSGCGTPSTSGSPVRWWYDNGNKDFMSDGGSPLTLIPVKDVVVGTNIMNAVNAVINGAGAIELATGYYKFKNFGSGKYLTSELNTTSGNRLVMGDVDNIFYYDQSSLLSYTEGLYVGISQTGSVYNVTLSDVTEEPVTAKVTSSAGAYYISLGSMNDYGNGVRFIYGKSDKADSGTQDEGFPADDGYKWDVEEITALPVEIGKTGWATIYAPVALEIPTGVEAYYVEKENFVDDHIILTSITDNAIPASTGVILYAKEAVGDGKVYYFEITESSSSYTTNLLDGTIAETLVNSEAYVLSESNGIVGLYKAEMNLLDNKAFLNNSHKAYLPVAKLENMSTSSGWRFKTEDNGITTIDKIQDDGCNTEIYDLAGRKINSLSQKGIYILNGKKVYVY